ncbi:MAG: DUF4956 domain-containing protein [Actinobacteria bacterium]|nr:MAG: DUF4956 domain-containing protein [Actinomycetota bacterium]
MSESLLLLADAVAVTILVFGLYFPRYRRRDMVLAIVSINVGVVAVATVLSRAEVTAGLGLGLFGVLSIIRLRSQELDQEEVAYYFSALALGLLGGVAIEPSWLAPVLMLAILTALYLVDNPRLYPRMRAQSITLDSAFTDEHLLKAHLEELIAGKVLRLKVKRVNLVSDTTTVDVRYRLNAEQLDTDRSAEDTQRSP